jgi:hypothetical protein
MSLKLDFDQPVHGIIWMKVLKKDGLYVNARDRVLTSSI